MIKRLGGIRETLVVLSVLLFLSAAGVAVHGSAQESIIRKNFNRFELKDVTTNYFKNSDFINSVSVAPDKNNIIYSLGADGNIYLSTDYGKTNSAVYQFPIKGKSIGNLRLCGIESLPGGYVYAFFRNNSETYLAFSANYGKKWQTTILNKPVYSMDVAHSDPETIYLGTATGTTHLTGVLKFNMKRMRFEDYAFATNVGDDGAPLPLLLAEDSKNYFGIPCWGLCGSCVWSDDKIPVSVNGGWHLIACFPDSILSIATYKDKNGKEEMLFATANKGILRKELPDGKIYGMNNVALKISNGDPHPCSDSFFKENYFMENKRIFNFGKEVLINPVKITIDQKHNLAFLATASQGVFICDLNDKNPVWYPMLQPYYTAHNNIPIRIKSLTAVLFGYKYYSDSGFLHLNLPHTVLHLSIINVKSLYINDIAISYNPFYVYLATNYGLVRLEFKNLH